MLYLETLVYDWKFSQPLCPVTLQMAIIFNEQGLDDIQPPCVAQTFHNHNAVLYKVFVIGEKHHIVERPSIKNFAATGKESKRPSIKNILSMEKNCNMHQKALFVEIIYR